MIKVRVIGAGFAGTFHSRAYARLPGARITIVADRNEPKAAALAAEVGARAEADAEAICAIRQSRSWMSRSYAASPGIRHPRV